MKTITRYLRSPHFWVGFKDGIVWGLAAVGFSVFVVIAVEGAMKALGYLP